MERPRCVNGSRYLLSEERYAYINHVGNHSGDQTADGVCQYGLGGQFTVSERIEHCGVGAEISAPAHPDGSEYSYGVAVNPPLRNEIRHQPQGCAYGTERRDGEGDQMRVMESEKHFENYIDFIGEPGKQLHTLVCRTGIFARFRRAEGQYHYQCGYNQHTGDDGYTDVDTRTASVER